MASVLKHSEGVAYGSPQLPTVCVLKIITPTGFEDCSRCSASPAISTTPPRFPRWSRPPGARWTLRVRPRWPSGLD
jgi:hypothetical protein